MPDSTPVDDGWERTRWLQMWTDDGSLWMETSSPGEIQEDAAQHPDLPVYRLYRRRIGTEEEFQRRVVTPERLAQDCVNEDEWYRKELERMQSQFRGRGN